MTYHLQFDGMLHTLSEDPLTGGFLGYGWLITRHGIEVAYGFGLFAHKRMANSNLAEYLALIEGLEASVDLRIKNEPLEICGDAKSVIDQMRGAASISSLPTQKLYRRARKLACQFSHLSWDWVPRNKNKLADQLSRRGFRQIIVRPNAYETALGDLNTRAADRSGFISLLDLRVYNPVSY